MATYSGRYYKGASKDIKAQKRAEAEARQAEALLMTGQELHDALFRSTPCL